MNQDLPCLVAGVPSSRRKHPRIQGLPLGSLTVALAHCPFSGLIPPAQAQAGGETAHLSLWLLGLEDWPCPVLCPGIFSLPLASGF